MAFKILPHARKRMKERKITVETVEKAISFPDKQQKDRTHSRRLLAKKLISIANKPYLLLVVFEQNYKDITVVTVITTSKILKYL